MRQLRDPSEIPEPVAHEAAFSSSSGSKRVRNLKEELCIFEVAQGSSASKQVRNFKDYTLITEVPQGSSGLKVVRNFKNVA